ncbi:MAG: GTP-binding protein [Candidatus Lokiarchaeota archaeon]|nr:GTP-binding protein [Candidatus Lokiarchaeota archaeon]MBD3202360.1 GTP-binding protein [Candidatus Lokiarchaeota archaeon]
MVDRKQKICFIGSAGVGKTSLVTLLQGKEIPSETTPTVGLEIEDSVLDGKRCSIWDLAGQERFQFMWKDFLKSSGLTVLVCESTEDSVKKTKEIAERFSNHLGSKVIAIANKQDLDDSISPDNVEKHLGIKTYGMSAIRPEYRARIKEILEFEFGTE